MSVRFFPLIMDSRKSVLGPLRAATWDPGYSHPSTAGIQTIRPVASRDSIDAGARRLNCSHLVLLPHDCRRVFASEHLNNNTPEHIIQR